MIEELRDVKLRTHDEWLYAYKSSADIIIVKNSVFGMIKAMNIHFICRGNVLRSLIAETYLKSLNLKDVNVISSGTNVNWDDPQEREYFANTLAVLNRHGIKSFAKAKSEQLTQERIDNNHSIIVLMNRRVVDEARAIVTLPQDALDWEIIDIGEGHRTDTNSRESYEEEIYQEITKNVDELLEALPYSS